MKTVAALLNVFLWASSADGHPNSVLLKDVRGKRAVHFAEAADDEDPCRINGHQYNVSIMKSTQHLY